MYYLVTILSTNAHGINVNRKKTEIVSIKLYQKHTFTKVMYIANYQP